MLRNEQYSLLAVMSELSTVWCDRALGHWIAGTHASSVDGELTWRSSGRAAAVASTPGSRVQATTEGRFLGLRHKTKERGWRLKTPSRGGTGVGLGTDGGDGRRRRLGPRCGARR